MTSDQAWVISWPNLEGLIAGGVSFVEPVVGNPACFISFDHARGELCIEITTVNPRLPRNLPRELAFRIKNVGNNQKRLIIACDVSALYRSFYDFGCEVLELVFAASHDPHDAVDDAWAKWGRLIEKQSVLSREKQIGLIGELWLLERIAINHGWEYSLASWHGDAMAEHDFCFKTSDVEVKSTASEARAHFVGSLTQLLPSVGRPLYILSIHLTGAPVLAEGTFSLASRVELIKDQVKNDEKLTNQLCQRLAQAGWKESHMQYYDASFIMRTEPSLVPVDENCPSLVPDSLSLVPAHLLQLIDSIMYRINVTGLGFVNGTPEFNEVLL